MLLIIIFLFDFRVFLSNSSHDCILMQILLTSLCRCPAQVKTSWQQYEMCKFNQVESPPAMQVLRFSAETRER
jgi:hypothetical protein